MRIIKMVCLLTVLSGIAFLSTGCENTVHGFGQDMQKTGQQIQKSVN